MSAAGGSLYLYAVTDAAPLSCPLHPGLQGAVPFLVDCGRLGGVVSVFGPGRPEVDAESVWRHEAVVEELLAVRPLLPVRFGTLVADEEHVRQALHEREDDLARNLARVRGRVELGLRVLWTAPEEEIAETAAAPAEDSSPAAPTEEPSPAPMSGREYLMRRLADEHRAAARRAAAQTEAQSVCGRLSGLATDSTLQLLPTPGQLLSAAFLVDREAVDGFVREVHALEASHGSLRFLCTGPWPPYSFVEAGPSGLEQALFGAGTPAGSVSSDGAASDGIEQRGRNDERR